MRQLRLRRIIRDKTAKISDYEEGSQWFSDRPIIRLRQIRRVPSVSIFRIFSVKNEITMEAKLKFDQMENICKYIYTLFSTFPITSPIERNTTKRALFAVVRRRPGLVFAVLRYRKH